MSYFTRFILLTALLYLTAATRSVAQHNPPLRPMPLHAVPLKNSGTQESQVSPKKTGAVKIKKFKKRDSLRLVRDSVSILRKPEKHPQGLINSVPLVKKAGDISEADTLIASAETDIGDVFSSLFSKKKKTVPRNKNSGSLVLLPSVGYTPSTGFEFGADVSGTHYFGDPETTTLSVFDAFGVVSTNELALLQFRHNIYSARNQWNIQGNWDLGKTVMLDRGLGTAHGQLPLVETRYTFIKLNELFYRNLLPNFYAGIGMSLNYYTNIDDDLEQPDLAGRYNYQYSIKNGFESSRYLANGLLINLQYNTRDQPYRPYKGTYVDLILKTNQQFLGSDRSALQLKTEVRKYWSLSTKNPEQVLAYWMWGSYLLSGTIPYLDLPGTGSDTEQRLGRGYTIGRFKGPSFFYNEVEYRFPITRNKLLSGVVFLNVQTASDQEKIKLLNYWEPGTGTGLRILFNKHTRSNLCIDYGIGNNGSRGVFVGLNEVF